MSRASVPATSTRKSLSNFNVKKALEDPTSYDDLGLLLNAIDGDESFSTLERLLGHLTHPAARTLWILATRPDCETRYDDSWHTSWNSQRALYLHDHLVKAHQA